MGVLAPDVVFIGDSGGMGRAPRHPVHGADKVTRFLLAIATTVVPELRVELTEVNAGPAIIISTGDQPMTVFVLDVLDQRVQTIHAIANPEKLHRVRSPGPVERG